MIPRFTGYGRRLLAWVKSPVKFPGVLLGCGGILITVGMYGRVTPWLEQTLPVQLEKNLRQTLGQSVQLGPVESLGLTQLKLGESFLPLFDPQSPLKVRSLVIDLKPEQLLHRRTLKAVVTLEGVEGLITIPSKLPTFPSLKLPKLPLPLDLTVKLSQVNIGLKQAKNPQVLNITTNAQIRYQEIAQQRWQYQASIQGQNLDFSVQGESLGKTGQSRLALDLKQFSLKTLNPLFPPQLLRIHQGNLQAHAKASIPPKQGMKNLQGKGLVNLDNLELSLVNLKDPLKFQGKIQLNNQTLQLEKGQLQWGKLTANLQGFYHWQKGFNLTSRVNIPQLAPVVQAFSAYYPALARTSLNQIKGSLQGDFQLTGPWQNPQLIGQIQTPQALSLAGVSLGTFQAQFLTDFDRFTVSQMVFQQDQSHRLIGQGTWQVGLLRQFKQNYRFPDWQKTTVQASLQGSLNPQGYWQKITPQNPTIRWQPLQVRGLLQGPLSQIQAGLSWQSSPTAGVSWQPLRGNALTLVIAGDVSWQAQKFQLRNQVNWGSGGIKINGQGYFKPLSTFTNIQHLIHSFQGLFNIDLSLAKQSGQITGVWQKAQLHLRGNFPGSVPLVTQSLPVKIAVHNTRFQAHYNLAKFFQNPQIAPLTPLQSTLQTQLRLNQSALPVWVTLNQGQWQAQFHSDRLNFAVLPQLPKNSLSAWLKPLKELDPSLTVRQLQGQLTGSLGDLFSQKAIPIQAKNLMITGKNYHISAGGKVQLTSLLSQPDLSVVNLAVKAKTPLIQANFNSLLDELPVQRNLLPENFKIQAQGQFTGNLQAPNLLSKGLQQVNLQGNLQVNQAQWNTLKFAQTLTGKIQIHPQKTIQINLQGQQDRLAATLTPCSTKTCLLPYLPQAFLLQQKTDSTIPLDLAGRTVGKNWQFTLNSLPIQPLQLAWFSKLGLSTYLGGQAQGHFLWEPASKQGHGALQWTPSQSNQLLEYLPIQGLKTDLLYRQNQLLLTGAKLQVNHQNYPLEKSWINFKTGELQAILNIPQGKVQDWLKPLDLTQLLPPNGSSLTAQAPRNSVPATVATQLNELWHIDQLLKQKPQKSEPPALLLDLQGNFTAEVAIQGNLTAPEVDFQLLGKRWIWQTQPTQPLLLSGLGFVLSNSSVLPIEKLQAKGKLVGNRVHLSTEIKTLGGQVSGDLALQHQAKGFSLQPSQLAVTNLPLDLLRYWSLMPLDVSGEVSFNTQVFGELSQPQVTGDFDLKNLALNGQLLQKDIAGQIGYQDRTISLQTDRPQSLDILVRVTLPTTFQGDYPFALSARLNTEALSLIDKLANERFSVTWEAGEGSLDLQAQGQFSLGNPFGFTLDPQSQLRLSLAKVRLKTPLLSRLVDLDGDIIFQNNAFVFESFQSQLGPQRVTSTGKLPLFPPSQGVQDPLTLTFFQNTEEPKGDRLYEGELMGKIQITGSALSPIIGGNLTLKNGVLALPGNRLPLKPNLTNQRLWFTSPDTLNIPLLIRPPQFKDLEITLENFELNQLKQRPFFRFNVGGDLRLQGFLTDLTDLRAQGKIQVNQGVIEFFPSSLFINPQQTNLITFQSERSLLNPSVDLNLQLYLFNLGLITTKDNEIPDDLVQSWRSQSLLLQIAINGDAEQLLPKIGNQTGCPLFPANTPPFSQATVFPSSNLQQFSNCLQRDSLAITALEDLVSSPLVKITSTPPLTRSQYLSLFANQYPDFALQLQGQNSQQLVKAGFAQVGATALPLLQDWIFQANQQTMNWGQVIGLDALQVYPTLSTQHRLDQNAVIRLDYDYTLNQGRIQYLRQF